MQKQVFYLTKRKLPSGKSVWYYYTYNDRGERSTPRSTGFTKKQDAFNFCSEKFKANKLHNRAIKFSDFASGWFKAGHPYYDDAINSGRTKPSTMVVYRSRLENNILPFFKNLYLDEITMQNIIKFREVLIDKNMVPGVINGIISTLSIMFNYAVFNEYISVSPIKAGFKSLVQPHSKREAFTLEEILRIFSTPIKSVKPWLMILTSVLTGMRISEIRGLDIKNVNEGYINIVQQYYKQSVVPSTKTKSNRFVPIPKKLFSFLSQIGKDTQFIFQTEHSDIKPICEGVISKALTDMFDTELLKVKNERKLTFHALRYFANTYYRVNGILEAKVNFIIGHSDNSLRMMNLYTTWKPEMFDDIKELQTKLLDLILEKVPNLLDFFSI